VDLVFESHNIEYEWEMIMLNFPLKDPCNAPISQVLRRYCDIHMQGENTLTYVH